MMDDDEENKQKGNIEMLRNNFEVVNEYQHLDSMFKIVEEVAADNIEYYVINLERSHHTDFVQSFQSIHNIVSPLQISLDVIIRCCSKFDLNPNCKGNGYRSIITIVECCLTQIIHISEQVQRNRDKLFFRSYQMYAELESYAQLLARLLTLVQFAIILLENSEGRWLFPKDTPKVNNIIEDLMGDFNNISRDCFYGRTFGFQYALSVRPALQVIAVAMAAYGDGYIRHTDTLSRAVSSVIHSGKYLIDPDLRAKRIAELSQGVDINFCKAFWSLTEEYGVQHAPLLVCPAMDVNLEFTIPSDDLNIITLNGTNTVIKFPVFNGLVGVKARLLSSVWRDGQIHNVWKKSTSYGPLGPKPRQRSRYLMLHCHGGGFVSQSSKSHEIYLRYWAKELRIPILSIDYSLSPDAVFPQALNEIFFAYVWALNNLKKLGTTGEKIVFTGDSAGANLVTAVIFKAILHNIRLPDSLVAAYPPYRVQYYPSPSRILCLMDPLLPLGVLKSCILAYVGDLQTDKKSTKKVDLLGISSRVYNPFELDFGKNHWDVSHSHNCGQFHSLSETNLDMIKHQLDPITNGYSEDEEYFSDCQLSDIESCSSDFVGIKSTNSYGDVFKKSSITKVATENLADKKGHEGAQSSGSLLQSLKSQVSLQVYDITSRVSSRVFDDIKSSVTQQIPAHVLDASSKVFNDIKTGVTNYLYERSNAQNTVNTKKPEQDDVQYMQVDDTTESTISSRKRGLNTVTPSASEESVKNIRSFSICKECLYPKMSCNCNMAWSGKILSTQKRVLSHYGSRHCLPKRNHISTIADSKCYHLHDTSQQNISDIECKQGNTSSDVPKKFFTSTSMDNYKMSNQFTPAESNAASTSVSRFKMSSGFSTRSDIISENAEHKKSNDYRNPLMSPIFATPELLSKMPPVCILACSLDPLFDDSVDFIRKLQDLDKDAELYVLDKLPHGFLNFQVFTNEAHEACDLMIACIKKSLNMGMARNDSCMEFACSSE